MNRIITMLRTVLLCLAFVTVAAGARAEDTVTLKSGRVVKGEIIREQEGYVWIKHSVGGIEQTDFLAPSDIAGIERDSQETPAPQAAVANAATPGVDIAPSRFGVPRAAVLTLGEGGDKDMVGIYMTAQSIRECIPLLEQEGVEVVVLLINSGGGALLEIQKLSDVIEHELKPKFRVVAWIKWAISAAAMTAHAVEEIYMMPEASYGACTGWSGALVAMKGRGFLEVIEMMKKISARGKHNPYIMMAMQGNANNEDEGFPLSCDFDANGDVIWYLNEEGDHLVNPKGQVLTFRSDTALKYKFSRGTAATLDELAGLMGYQEIEWVGEETPGYIYPICLAEKQMMAFRNKTFKDGERMQEYFVSYNTAVQLAAGTQDEKDRGMLVGRARRHLEQIKSVVRNNPNYLIMAFNMLNREWSEWVEQQEKLLRDLMK